ncbi:hypothetical protein QR680_009552 [Steinernema hermaphroditum]|uniref:Uncharacterized protein n=1 Tax=Steinernema hermaphroditum TaxID=289476 RepID=A0AA39MA59_9BILA|nr:hypothetical protein QR680_009552 [Steinernema hermaphroditum]
METEQETSSDAAYPADRSRVNNNSVARSRIPIMYASEDDERGAPDPAENFRQNTDARRNMWVSNVIPYHEKPERGAPSQPFQGRAIAQWGQLESVVLL